MPIFWTHIISELGGVCLQIDMTMAALKVCYLNQFSLRMILKKIPQAELESMAALQRCPPVFGRSVILIPIGGADYAHHITTGPPDFWTMLCTHLQKPAVFWGSEMRTEGKIYNQLLFRQPNTYFSILNP